MATRLQQPPGDESVLLRLFHSNLQTFSSETRLSLQTLVESVKEKLWRKCGTFVDSMYLELYDDTGSKVSHLDDNSRPLGFCSPLDGYRLHIIDLDPSSVISGGWLEDTSPVEKYQISDEAYDKHDGTFKKFKEKIASQNPSAFERKITDNYTGDLCMNVKGRDRCEVEPGAKRGVVKFAGKTESLAPGFWIGVQYDEPLGKHDGMRFEAVEWRHGTALFNWRTGTCWEALFIRRTCYVGGRKHTTLGIFFGHMFSIFRFKV